MTGESRGFPRAVARRVVFLSSYDGELREHLVWPQGSPVSIRVARGSVELLFGHGRGIRRQDSLKNESRVLFRAAGGNLAFPRHLIVTSGSFSWCLGKAEILWSWEWPLGTPLRSEQWKRASSRVKAGTSGFLSCSDVGLRMCMPFKTGSHDSTCVEAWNSVVLSSCHGVSGFQAS